jgi:hypothetical protein
VLRDHPELRNVSRLTLVESFRCVQLVLWDEGQQRLVSFRDMRQCFSLRAKEPAGAAILIRSIEK